MLITGEFVVSLISTEVLKGNLHMPELFQLALPHGITLSCRAAGQKGQPVMVFRPDNERRYSVPTFKIEQERYY